MPVGKEYISRTKITLPEIALDKKTIGGNQVVQIAQNKRILDVDIYAYSSEVYIAIDKFGRKFYIQLPNSEERMEKKEYVLRVKELQDILDLDEKTVLIWEQHYRKDVSRVASEISKSWADQFSFIEENTSLNRLGLRQPQIGALHAIASHWSVTESPAIIVMPTGTGKTEVMLSTLVLGSCEKVLILVPSKPLRDQIFNKAVNFGCLTDIGVVPDNIVYPRVSKVKRGIKKIDELKELLDNSNVVIATASVLNKFNEECLRELGDRCSHLFVDEAHHTPAPTWLKITDLFKEKPILLFTATPFRNDGKRVGGSIMYDYPLGLAQKNGYFKEINLIRINEIDDSIADEKIAIKAVSILKADIESGMDHILMARTKNINKADDLLRIYDEIAPELRPTVIHSEMNVRNKEAAMEDLGTRKTRIIICVDMLGEGFDLPNLKIAAIHDIHKSLPITLQFIGRFTRISSDKIGNATVVVNSADLKVDKSINALYSENPDWNIILRERSESAIKKEKVLQEVIQSFKGELSKQISLWNLRPAFSTLIYETNCEEWLPDRFNEVLPPGFKRWHSINHDQKILVIVINRQEEVKWGKYKDITNESFDLCIAYWHQEKQKLFIQCSNYDVFNCNALAKIICGDKATIFNGHQLFGIFSDIDHPMVQNLGASRTGTISYTMYFGPEVTTGLSAIDRAESTPNNIFGWGYEEGDKVTYGCSAKSGKVWSRGGGSIVDWKEWCIQVEKKLSESDLNEAEIISGFLRPLPLNGRHSSVAIGVEWGERLAYAQENTSYVFFGTEECKLFDVSLEVVKHSEDGPIYIVISSEISKSEYRIDYEAGADEKDGKCIYTLESGPEVHIKRHGGGKIPFLDYVITDQLIIRYADGSFSYGNYHISIPMPEAFDLEGLVAVDWDVNIHQESQGKEVNRDSIQYKTIEAIKDEYDIIINDDGSGEAADIIAFRKDSDESYSVHLIHCKYSKTDKPGRDIGNMYELCGQAQKSIRWKHLGMDALSDHIKKRELKWREQEYTRFVKGSSEDLSKLIKFSRFAKLNFAISIVQPGLSKEKISSDIIQLLSCTENYLIKTSNASFKVICSR